MAASAAAALAACTPQEPINSGLPPVSRPAIPLGARKGVGLALGKNHGVKHLDALDINWFYTWGAKYPAVRPTPGFVPMIWGGQAVRRNTVDDVLNDLGTTEASELLGFNEPDHPEQADMTVASAIAYWPALEASGLRLGSPSPVHIRGDWFKAFMDQAAAKDRRVDFITMHSYASPNSESFLNIVQEVYDRYGKPIWITEYAVADWEATATSPSRYSAKEIMAFMGETAAGFRDMPFVERFAWKTRPDDDPVMGASALYRKDGSLSPTGELYRSL